MKRMICAVTLASWLAGCGVGEVPPAPAGDGGMDAAKADAAAAATPPPEPTK